MPRLHLAATAAIFNAAGEILLVRLSYDQGQWALPGGGLEAGESPVEAAVREAREETGLEVAVESLYGVYYRRDNDSIIFAFRSRVTGGALAADGAEILEARYFSIEGLPRPMTNGTLMRIEDARKGEPAQIRTVDRIEYLR